MKKVALSFLLLVLVLCTSAFSQTQVNQEKLPQVA